MSLRPSAGCWWEQRTCRGEIAAAEREGDAGLHELWCIEGFHMYLKARSLSYLEVLIGQNIGVIESGTVAVKSPRRVALGVKQRGFKRVQSLRVYL